MIALPCGHQICLTDLKRLKMDVATPVVVSTPVVSLPVRQGRLQDIRRLRQRRRQRDIRTMRFNGRVRRCGWCGLQGHKISKCRKHRFQCGCRDYKSRRHIHILNTKRNCRICNHKGHRADNCFKVVRYR